jgi:IS5 family transposase
VKHKRREGYWRLYDKAQAKELDELIITLKQLVDEEGDPYVKHKRGRPRIHSPKKMALTCILRVILGISYRNMQTLLKRLNLPWREPIPDHSTIQEAFNHISEAYLNRVLQRTAELCIAESGWIKGIVASDSTGVKTDRYHTVEVKMKKTRKLITLKWHVTAILDYNVILTAQVTSGKANDSRIGGSMLQRLPRLEGSVFDADRGYDSDRNCRLAMEKGMKPNIKQRKTGGKNRGLRFRKVAALMFDLGVYHFRGLVEGIFGALEVERGLETRCRLRKAQKRWGLALAIGHNLGVLNRLRVARQLDVVLSPILQNVEA